MGFAARLKRKWPVFERDVLRAVQSVPAYLAYRAGGRLPAPARAAVPGLSRRDLQLYLYPWYHDFAPLGVATPQAGGHFPANQRAKAPVLERLVRRGLSMVEAPEPTTVELFCADGYYSSASVLWGAGRATAIDWNPYHIERAALAARLLGIGDRVECRREDVHRVTGRWDLLLNLGGLYHISDPASLLAASRSLVGTAMVVQTVYSLAVEDPDYFEAPAPGWTWGCRFSLRRFERMLEETGWKVLEIETNELLGNDRPEDRGSVYALCVPAR